MAVDLKTIAKTVYDGIVDGTPYGLVGPSLTEYRVPFDKWPQDVKDGYTYNPDGAKKLLADAGYPKGFNTNVVVSNTYVAQLDLLEVVKSYFSNIGISMEIKVMDAPSFTNLTSARKQDGITHELGAALDYSPLTAIGRRYVTSTYNYGQINDTTYNSMYEKASTTLNHDELVKLIKDADMYAIAQYWAVNFLPIAGFDIYQPWFKGYSGEDLQFPTGFIYGRCWIDQTLKK